MAVLSKMNKEFKKAIKDTIPVMTGYIVLGAGFGILMDANGLGFIHSVLMSVFIYAGSLLLFWSLSVQILL